MEIYNTLTRKKEKLDEKKIGMYVCGPTVYDESHIGHARSAYIFDIIVRFLRHEKKKITFVRNVTDIDDKIIDRARLEPGQEDLKIKVRKIAEKYLNRYHEDMQSLGLIKPDIEPKATETIKDMIKFVQVLIKRGYAYEASGNVYFSVRKFEEYGKLSGRSPDQMMEGARLAPDKNKKDPLDFALWKRSKGDEPSWLSPWGEGRPGWHIECSVMSTKYLKNNFLIHGGGLDLVFPHHENEIAQTICAGKKSAKYWIHNGLLTINNQKMAKSLGNFITIKDFQAKHKDLDALKLFFLSNHYRHPADYTEEKIEEMKKAKQRIGFLLYKIKMAKKIHKKSDPNEPLKIHEIEESRKKFIEAMDNDFNTPKALSYIFDLVSLGYGLLAARNFNRAGDAGAAVSELCAILGIQIEFEIILDEEEEKLVQEREKARLCKDFNKADEIRQQLFSRGVILEDTKEGTIAWREKL